MRSPLLALAAAAALSGCLPASGEISYDVSGPDGVELRVTLTPDLEEDLTSRPRSTSDTREPAELLASAAEMASRDPRLCARLAPLGEVVASYEGPSVTCTVTLPAAVAPFAPDPSEPVAGLWVMREIFGASVTEVLRDGYSDLPVLSGAGYQGDLATARGACESGSEGDCLRLYEDSPEGSADEVVALLGLRDDLVGRSPAWLGTPLPLGVVVRVTHPGLLQEHNGTVSPDGSVIWEFDSEAPGEARRGLRISWEEVTVPTEVARDGSGVRTFLGGTLLVGALGLLVVAFRKAFTRLRRRGPEPRPKKVKTRTLSAPRRRR